MIKKVLVVDTNRQHLCLIRKIIRHSSYQYINANSFKQASQLIDKHSDISLILLDTLVPSTKDLEVVKSIKTAPNYKGIPIIFISNDENSYDYQDIDLSCDCAFHIKKPILIKPFLETLENVIPQQINKCADREISK